MYNFFKIFIAVVAVTFIVTNDTFVIASNPPLPRRNPFSSGWGGQIMDLGIKDPEARRKLLGISDIQIKQNILNAKSGSCPAVRTTENSKVKVENAKQCGKTPEEKKKKNGKKCTATGIQGGSIDAMCINGCCIAISVKQDKNNFNNGNLSNTTQNGQQSYGGGGSNSMMQSFMQMLQGMMGGGGGGGAGNYGNPYLPTNPEFPTSEPEPIDVPVETEPDPKPDTAEEEPVVMDEPTDIKPGGQNISEPGSDEILTVISRKGTKIEVKVDKNSQSDRYAFVQPKTGTDNTQAPPTTNQVIQSDILQREKNISVHKKEGGISHTGFRGEKVAAPKVGIWERISIWLASLLGLN